MVFVRCLRAPMWWACTGSDIRQWLGATCRCYHFRCFLDGGAKLDVRVYICAIIGCFIEIVGVSRSTFVGFRLESSCFLTHCHLEGCLFVFRRRCALSAIVVSGCYAADPISGLVRLAVLAYCLVQVTSRIP